MKGLYLVLDELEDMTGKKLIDAKEKARAAGSLSSADIEYLDRLTHTLKSIVTTKAMVGHESGAHEEESSERRMRDSMGRFTSRMAELMDEAPNEHVRSEMRRLITSM